MQSLTKFGLIFAASFLFTTIAAAGNCRYSSSAAAYAAPVVVEQQVQAVPSYAPADCVVQQAPVATYAPVIQAAPVYQMAAVRTVAYQPVIQQQVVRQVAYAPVVQQQVVVHQRAAVYGGYGGTGFLNSGGRFLNTDSGFVRSRAVGGGFGGGGGLIGLASNITGLSPEAVTGIGVGILGARAFPGVFGLRR